MPSSGFCGRADLSYRAFKQRFGAELPLVDVERRFAAPLTYDHEFQIKFGSIPEDFRADRT